MVGLLAAAAAVVVTICHFADFYNATRAAQLVGVLQTLPCDIKTVGGDFFGPSALSTLTKGEHAVDLMNFAEIDFVLCGNHECDYGLPNLLRLMAKSKFAWLTTNMPDLPGLRLALHKPTNVGFIGLTTTDTIRDSSCHGIRILDACGVARRAARRLRNMGAVRIVALTHFTQKQDLRLLACPGVDIDVVLGGHDHDAMSFEGANGAWVHKVNADGAEIGVLKLLLTQEGEGDDGHNDDHNNDNKNHAWTRVPIPQTASVPTPLAELVSPLPLKKHVVGVLSEPLDFSFPRQRHASGGRFVTEAMLAAAPDADMAIVLGGSLRSNHMFPAGQPFTQFDLLNVFPFPNQLVLVLFDATVLNEVLRAGETRGDRFLHTAARSGGSAAAEPTANNNSTSNTNKQHRKKKFVEVVTTDYLAAGKLGYDEFVSAVQQEPLGVTLTQAVTMAIQARDAGARSTN